MGNLRNGRQIELCSTLNFPPLHPGFYNEPGKKLLFLTIKKDSRAVNRTRVLHSERKFTGQLHFTFFPKFELRAANVQALSHVL